MALHTKFATVNSKFGDKSQYNAKLIGPSTLAGRQ